MSSRTGDLIEIEEVDEKKKGEQLLEAVDEGDCQKASSILQNYTIKGSGLLCVAVLKKWPEMVKLLVDHKSDVDARFDNLWPLQVAVETESEDIVEILLEAGANVNAIDDYGSTVLHFLQDSGSHILKRLIKAGAHPAVRNSMELTPLHNAAIKGFTNIIAELCSCKEVAINAKDHDGRTPLHYALLYSHERAALKLIEFGANVRITSKLRETPFDIADDNGLSKAADELLKKGAYSKQLPCGSIYSNENRALSLMVGRVKN